MTSEEDILYLYLLYRIYRRSKRRRVWVNPINRDREKYGILPIYPRLVDDVEEFYVYTKMTPDIFDDLCAIVSPEIRKMDTNFREAIPPRERLLMTLRYLASGDSFRSLSYQFRVGTSTIRKIVYETCEAIWKRCHATEIPQLQNADLKASGADFQRRWNFPNCMGCIVGKKIRISCTSSWQWPDNNNSSNSGSKKDRRSMILQGVVDARGNFVAIDVGDFERHGDSGPAIFRQTSFGKALMRDQLDLPAPEVVEGSSNKPLPYVFIASISYPLLPRLLRPYPKRDLTVKRKLFNDKLAHAHKCSELAFGSLVERWGVLKSVMTMDPPQVCKIVRACCILHNFVRHRAASTRSESGMPGEEDAEDVFDILPTITKSMIGRPRDDAIEVRDSFANYFYESQAPSSVENGAQEAHEPLLELECQEDETTPMEEQEDDEEGEDEFQELDFSREKPTEDKKPEHCLNFNDTKPERDFDFQLGKETQSNENPQLKNWPESLKAGGEDTGEATYPESQCPGESQPSLDAEQEVDVKPEIIYVVKI